MRLEAEYFREPCCRRHVRARAACATARAPAPRGRGAPSSLAPAGGCWLRCVAARRAFGAWFEAGASPPASPTPPTPAHTPVHAPHADGPIPPRVVRRPAACACASCGGRSLRAVPLQRYAVRSRTRAGGGKDGGSGREHGRRRVARLTSPRLTRERVPRPRLRRAPNHPPVCVPAVAQAAPRTRVCCAHLRRQCCADAARRSQRRSRARPSGAARRAAWELALWKANGSNGAGSGGELRSDSCSSSSSTSRRAGLSFVAARAALAAAAAVARPRLSCSGARRDWAPTRRRTTVS